MLGGVSASAMTVKETAAINQPMTPYMKIEVIDLVGYKGNHGECGNMGTIKATVVGDGAQQGDYISITRYAKNGRQPYSVDRPIDVSGSAYLYNCSFLDMKTYIIRAEWMKYLPDGTITGVYKEIEVKYIYSEEVSIGEPDFDI